MRTELQSFLMEYARNDTKYKPFEKDKYWSDYPIVGYHEDINKDANSDNWLLYNTSYIYKVATLTIMDDNKRDFGYVYIGIQRTIKHAPEFFGFYHLPDGENTDCHRVIKRIVTCLQQSDVVFEE